MYRRLLEELGDAAIEWMDSTESTKYDAENKFWSATQALKDERQRLREQPKPTIAELEKILTEDSIPIKIGPNGEIYV